MSNSKLITTTGNAHQAYRRHIIIDNVSKVIHIEVQAAIGGNLKMAEYRAIEDGNWHRYVPPQFIPQLREAIAGGYTVRPVMVTGQENEAYRVLQVVDVKVKNLVG